MRRAPTIRDVARVAGVSVSVVSRVLNEGSGPVAPATRVKVVQAIDDLAYRPRAAARELSQGGQPLTIGLLLADLTNPFFAKLADRVVWEARARGAQVVLMTTQEDPHLEAEALDTLLDRSVGGVIATPSGDNLESWSRLRQVGIDVVFVDRTLGELEQADLVSIKNGDSARTTTDYLIAMGHQRIGLLSGPLNTSTGLARVSGYREALAAAGIGWDQTLVRNVPFRGNAGGDAVSSLLSTTDAPTALIVANTAQVQNAIRRLLQLGTQIPDDVSVIVFDDNPWAELLTPPLSAVHQPIELLALHSVELLLGRMHGRIPGGARTIEVQAEFIPRGSCAPPLLARK